MLGAVEPRLQETAPMCWETDEWLLSGIMRLPRHLVIEALDVSPRYQCVCLVGSTAHRGQSTAEYRIPQRRQQPKASQAMIIDLTCIVNIALRSAGDTGDADCVVVIAAACHIGRRLHLNDTRSAYLAWDERDQNDQGSKRGDAELRVQERHGHDDAERGGHETEDLVAELLQRVHVACGQVIDVASREVGPRRGRQAQNLPAASKQACSAAHAG